jgi:branched-chain amino acid transport system permease protein
MGSILFTTAAWALLEVAGQPVFGISALAGLGVYAFALTAQNGNINPWLAIIIGIIVATFVGMLLSIPSMKIGGIMNQGILNIFFVFAFSAFIAAFSSFTGGTAGVALEILPPTDIFKQLPYKYMIIMIITVIGVGAIYCILKTRVGKIIALTAKNERLASTLGIDITKYKRLAYLIFIPFIALAGFCSSYTTGFTSPSYWSVELSFITILSFWIGGSGSILGPIVGAALISSIPTLFNVAMEWRIVICGVLALVIRMFLPEGLVGLFSRKPKALGKGIHKKLAIK